MVLHNTTLVPSLGLRMGPACEAGLSAGMQTERVPPRMKKERKKKVMFAVFVGSAIRINDVIYEPFRSSALKVL